MNKHFLELFRKATAPKPIQLGQPPWSVEELTQAYFRNSTLTERKIESRPGARFAHAIDALELSLALFKDAVEALFASIETFRKKSREPNFHWRVSQLDQERDQLAVRRNLFSATAAALALVEHSRTIQKRLKISGYQERIDQDFKHHIDHRLIQELRDYVIHSRLLPADWRISIKYGEGQELRFFLRKIILLSSKKWSRPIKEYLNNLDYGVDLEELFQPYLSRVEAFQAWHIAVIELAGDYVLNEYREYQRIIKGIGWRTSNRIILHIARSAKIDPSKYLDQYLFPNEIEYVQSAQNLKEKVDRIIEILDEYKACDEELRSEVYKLFGID